MGTCMIEFVTIVVIEPSECKRGDTTEEIGSGGVLIRARI